MRGCRSDRGLPASQRGEEAITDTGTVRASAAPIRLATATAGYEHSSAGEYATVTVADDGRGIEAAGLSRVVEPFFTRRCFEAAERFAALGTLSADGVLQVPGHCVVTMAWQG
jgi:hypothetical protein